MTLLTTSDPMPLLALLERRVRDNDSISFGLTESWMQGRTTYGGLIAALSVQAIRDVAGADWPLRSLQASFVGPIAKDMTIEVRRLRQGRAVRQIQGIVHSGGSVAAVLIAVFGSNRETSVPVRKPAQPHARSVEEAVPPPAEQAPNFCKHIEVKWAEGPVPYSEQLSWSSRIYARILDSAPDQELSTVLLADVPPPPLVSMFAAPTPVSSVSWELELVPLDQPCNLAAWWLADTDTVSAAHGYSNQRTALWAPNGELAALGYQVVGIYG